MSEKEKMLRGESYNASDTQLVLERDRAARILTRYNRRPFREVKKKNKTMQKLLNTSGNFWVKPPFYCDYGYNIYLGNDVLMNYGCILLDVCKISIGDSTLIGPNTQLYTACHAIDPKMRKDGVEFGKEIHIGKNVWIGGNSTICPGVSIGDNSVIGAGSVVTRSIPCDVVAFGNPCCVQRNITEEDRKIR